MLSNLLDKYSDYLKVNIDEEDLQGQRLLQGIEHQSADDNKSMEVVNDSLKNVQATQLESLE